MAITPLSELDYGVSANNSPSTRAGTMTIAGQTFTVLQAFGCMYSIFPAARALEAGVGSDVVVVTTLSICN